MDDSRSDSVHEGACAEPLYGIAGADCNTLIAGLQQAELSIPTDPLCDPSIRVRYVLTPDPLITYPIAAAAWGWTYNADCLDLPTLEAFVRDHYAQAPEDFCTNGQATF